MRAVGLQPIRQVSRHPVQDPLSKDCVGLNILIAAIPVNLLLNRSDVVKYLKVAFAGLARMELVDILLIQHQALEVKHLGRGAAGLNSCTSRYTLFSLSFFTSRKEAANFSIGAFI